MRPQPRDVTVVAPDKHLLSFDFDELSLLFAQDENRVSYFAHQSFEFYFLE
jgi:hypothetical protein